MQPLRSFAVASALALAAISGSAHAQDAAPAAAGKPGFGDRSNGVFAVENVFGIAQTTETESINGKSDSQTIDDKGFFPGAFGPRVSLHGVSKNLTYGAVFSAWWAKGVGDQSLFKDTSVWFFTVGPRIGYAAALPKQPMIGYWVRTGPTFIFAHAGNSHTTTVCSGAGGCTTQTTTDTQNTGTFAWSIDAYGVVAPVDHFAVFFGPSFDIAIYGQSGGHDQKYGAINFGIGMLADW